MNLTLSSIIDGDMMEDDYICDMMEDDYICDIMEDDYICDIMEDIYIRIFLVII